MFEKVNPSHPDKVADRIAGAIVDLAYEEDKRPRIAVEVLIGHGQCHIIAETSVHIEEKDVKDAVNRIAGNVVIDYMEKPQDEFLADNQSEDIRCGDNGIFKGMPVTEEQSRLSRFMRGIYGAFPTDGKAVIHDNSLILCQSNAHWDESKAVTDGFDEVTVNPLGYWTGGTDVDTGATNRKLGSDMGDAVTGGGIHGKDLSKADVSVNIMCHILAQEIECEVTAVCAIGDGEIVFAYDGDKNSENPIPYAEVVEEARKYIDKLGGFEKLAEWGLV